MSLHQKMPAISHESYVHKSHLYKQTMDTLNLVTFSGHFGGSFSGKATRNLAQKTLCEEIGQKIKAWNLRQPEVLAQKGAAFWPRPETMQLGAFTRAIEDSIKNYMGPNPNGLLSKLRSNYEILTFYEGPFRKGPVGDFLDL